jgi:hypothetical protein
VSNQCPSGRQCPMVSQQPRAITTARREFESRLAHRGPRKHQAIAGKWPADFGFLSDEQQRAVVDAEPAVGSASRGPGLLSAGPRPLHSASVFSDGRLKEGPPRPLTRSSCSPKRACPRSRRRRPEKIEGGPAGATGRRTCIRESGLRRNATTAGAALRRRRPGRRVTRRRDRTIGRLAACTLTRYGPRSASAS